MQKIQMCMMPFLLLMMASAALTAQESAATSSQEPVRVATLDQSQPLKTFYLHYMTEPSATQDIVNTLRTTLNVSRVSIVTPQHAIVVRATPEQLAMSEKLITELDRPPVGRGSDAATYRLDFLVSEFEDGKKVNTRNYSLLVQTGSKDSLKVGARVPITTAGKDGGASQVQYMDVGLNLDCHLWADATSALVDGTVEVSGLANAGQPNGNAMFAGNPVVRQSKTNFLATVPLGKPTLVASLDQMDAPRRMEIEVTATRAK